MITASTRSAGTSRPLSPRWKAEAANPTQNKVHRTVAGKDTEAHADQ
jgi:hypothetical protein